MNLLGKINGPEDVRALDKALLPQLCREIRDFLLCHVADSGGHLASNLGTVELTVALHRVYDTRRDRVVFDVGHQCYTHKILTDRRTVFAGLRSFGRLAGFPKPDESPHDAFATGHASTAVSAALGMARARTLRGETYDVLALLGDGALTGGLAYEALNDAGQSEEPLVVILNDNGMSISQNVGGVARHLSKLRLKPQYFRLKEVYHRALNALPGGRRVDRCLHNLKTAVKNSLLPGSMFEKMGFVYLGPTDGHDVETVTRLLAVARAMRRPVLLHLITQKGRGYVPSETDPAAFHGVTRFDVFSGRELGSRVRCYSDVFGDALCELAREDKRICAVTAAMADGTGLSGFALRFPKRFFDVGIAEAHAVTMAAGLAKQGMRPICAVYSTFLQRAYDQILHDVALQKLPVIFAVDRAGLVGEDGETHHGVFDPAFLTHIPHMKLWAPASFAELRAMLAAALQEEGPVAIRYPRKGEDHYSGCHLETVQLREGSTLTLVTYGTMTATVLEAAARLSAVGIEADVLKLSSLQPLDTAAVSASLQKTGRLAVVEDCVNEGCAGSRLLSALAAHGAAPPGALLLNLGDRFITHGAPERLARLCGLDAEGIARSIGRMVGPRILRAVPL
ncbi:MAG: 1-deoxy-D-xylulose-5-phosphate synthase [Oscillospiraceae bacterium]|jgi:1-deoxy-D-xylulose-5-phosphate synthase|nr:1-deoxy-D-xylulose-5-phosphate synthase [Oscillospiraceae bacterium]